MKKTSKHNQVSEPSSSTYSDAKMITLESLNNKENNGLLFKNSLVQFCKDNITQLNDTNKKGYYIYIFKVLDFI